LRRLGSVEIEVVEQAEREKQIPHPAKSAGIRDDSRVEVQAEDRK
jgi:hypothetical protein